MKMNFSCVLFATCMFLSGFWGHENWEQQKQMQKNARGNRNPSNEQERIRMEALDQQMQEAMQRHQQRMEAQRIIRQEQERRIQDALNRLSQER